MPMPRTYIPALRFHALTRFYDPVVRLTTREYTLKHRLVSGLGPSPKRVLDLGCGTGTLLRLLRQAYPDAELFGLDADPAVLAQARRKLGREAVVALGDMVAPPFHDELRFDRIVSSLVFHHLTREEKLQALRAAHRLLGPGGELHLADWGAPRDPLMRLAFLGIQLLDGFETTADNVRGNLPQLMMDAGFSAAWEDSVLRTPLGSASIYHALS